MNEEPALESDLLDVTDIDLTRLAELPETALRAALHRILTDHDDLPDQYAAFESAL
ncbi:FxSxx-COOH cyclophane-containing RiPP peptide [Actinosynnema sp. NPDC020468]|uniref:FxSxx-COOH cyclophane-containing RiPP peptide n=1 Tax=Actinosynnema sp. NPDC020468 TaxID=3154488 RepID=UPI003406E8A3